MGGEHRNSYLYQRRRDKRGEQNVDADRRHSHAEHDGDCCPQYQQQGKIAGPQLHQREREREAEAANVEGGDDETGRRGGIQELERQTRY